MSQPSIHCFNPFTLQHGSDVNLNQKIQEVIYYAESRFWYIINEISSADLARQTWTQKILLRELRFVLSYVGMATSFGLPIKVPIIIRSLAISLASLRESDLPLPFDPGFLATLDAGAHDSHHKSRVVKNYKCAWWTGRKPRDLGAAGILDESSLDACLKDYRRQVSTGNDTDPPSSAQPSTILAQPAMDDSKKAGCRQCTRYCDLLSDVLLDVLDIHKVSSAMSTSSQNQWNLDMRRASTFHILHQAAGQKETANTSPLPSASKSKHMAAVAQKAQDELSRLQNLPPSSYKWTWGEILTEADVLALRRPVSNPGRTPNSGYHGSLMVGKLTGIDSSDHSIPASHDRSDLIPDIPGPLPPAEFAVPRYLQNYQQLVFDPLSDDNMSSSSSHDVLAPELALPDIGTGADALRPVVAAETRLVLADDWPSGSEDEATTALVVADEWRSGSENDADETNPASVAANDWPSETEHNADGTTPAPAPVIADNWPSARDDAETGAIADHWSSASSQDSGPNVTSGPSVPVAIVADEWSSDSENANAEISPPSSITLHVRPSFPETDFYDPPVASDNLPSASAHVVSGPRRYQPDDFNYLSEEMFHQDSSDEDSDGSVQ